MLPVGRLLHQRYASLHKRSCGLGLERSLPNKHLLHLPHFPDTVNTTRTSSLVAVVFDLDGLMFDTETLYAETARQILERRQKQLTDDLLHDMMGRKSDESLAIMIERRQLSDTVEQLRNETDQIFAELIKTDLVPMRGLWELLDALQSHQVPLAIATSSRRNNVDPILDKFEIRPRFQFVLTSENVKNGKPHPEIYLTAAERLGMPTRNIMVLEDSQNGCRSAVAAGTMAVAVPGEHSRHHDFSGAAFIADGLDDERIWQALGI